MGYELEKLEALSDARVNEIENMLIAAGLNETVGG